MDRQYANGSPRKKWSKDESSRQSLKEAAVQEVLPGYEDYLLLLQERNRLLKKMRRKNKSQIEQEKKEKGFSIYVNGANSGRRRSQKSSAVDTNDNANQAPKSHRLKTAGDAPRRGVLDHEYLSKRIEEKKREEEQKRVKTAPARERRRNWLKESVELQTARGEKCRLKAPELVTGNYDDDFEDEEDSDDEDEDDLSDNSIDNVKEQMSRKKKPDEEEGRVRYKRRLSTPVQQSPKSRSQEVVSDSDNSSADEEVKEKLMLSIADVKDEEDSARSSPIPEEDEEVEEDLVPAMDSLCLDQKVAKPLFKPTDTIVLELSAPPPRKGKLEKNLSIARKKDVEMDTSYQSKSSNTSSKTPRAKSAVLQSNVTAKKSNRPLSANRVSRDHQADPKEEASAVLAALKAENDKAAKGRQRIPATSISKQEPKPSVSKDSPLRKSDIRRSGPTPSPRSKPATTPRASADDSKSFLADDRLTNIMKKVLMMQPKQQKKLMKVLGDLDDSLEEDKLQHIPKASPSEPVKATRPVQDMVQKSAQKSTQKSTQKSVQKSTQKSMQRSVQKSVQKSLQKSVEKSPNRMVDEGVEVNIEITSNWGHPALMGLTEIQFFDVDGHLVPVFPDNISTHGAQDQQSPLSVLFNGKYKTSKERNMWVCKYRHGHPVELCIVLPHTFRGKPLEISKMKIWNFNKSINDLEVGIKDTRVFIGGELMYDGAVDKGCGNQVFDYGAVINCRDPSSKSSSSSKTNASTAASKPPTSPVSRNRNTSPVSKTSPTPTSPKVRHDENTGGILLKPTLSPRSRAENAKKHSGSIEPITPTEDYKKPPAFSRLSSNEERRPQSESSNSSNENTAVSRPKEVKVRSETRTMNYAEKDKNKDLRRPSVTSDRSGSEADEDNRGESKMPSRHRGSRTPRKSKRMAAKLDGHSSEEARDSARSVNDSSDQRPPRPVKKSEDKPAQPEEQKAEVSVHNSVSQSQGDTSMIQQLKQMNQRDQKRKKDIPKWLKSEDVSGAFENPVASHVVSDSKPVMEAPPEPDSKETVDQLIEEEMAMWPEKKELKTVFNDDKPPIKEGEAKNTPMQKIQQNRAKWRESQKKNLEESWGSLNMFDRHQKGRISMDLDDDALDEYLKPLAKPQPTIAEEEGETVQITANTEEISVEDEDFIIPELPYGKDLVIDIRSTWGDNHYVGLTGIEVFSSTGEPVVISKITANPLDINILPEYNKDPRVVSNLIDGVNRTRDDVHMWLAPFSRTAKHMVYLTFEKPCKVALMRIWNYNKSRIHSYRGVKDAVITLDNVPIFKGEIARACGGIEGGTEAFGDTFLFTMDENTLEAISKNDDAYEGDMFSDDELYDVAFERPDTDDEGDDNRPFTRACGNVKTKAKKEAASLPRPATSITGEGDLIVFRGRCLELNFTETWGDLHYMGLTSLEVVGKDGEALPIKLSMLTAIPMDLHSLPGHERDDRTLDKVIDGINVTMSDEHMWLVPFTDGNNHTLSIDFGQTVLVAGLRVWNYNKSPEDTYRGAKTVHVTIDGKKISPREGYLIRKGPGVCHFDFAQEISFAPQEKPAPVPSQPKGGYGGPRSSVSEDDSEYEAVQMPCGFIYQLQLMSTWGDPYYIGLNGIEFYDAALNQIQLTETNISAYPDSVNVLNDKTNDARTPDKLIDGVHDTTDGSHMWLAPVLPSMVNRVYVIFDQPTTVSMIKIWNYSKTPQRGAKDLALLVDDLLVYNGMLHMVTTAARGILPNMEGPQRHHTIVFTQNKEILQREKHTIISNQAVDQDIQLTNDKMVVSHYNDPKKAQAGKPVNQELRPKTSVAGQGKKRR
ncbi:katanin-interacting protein-like isoform X2 [Argopecten irradians]|uniref:katanin-interacting protein-like isoform X2 n=1 Tax=Argopecten irradians TaxID=31199 RepID=UPI003715A9F1